MNRIDPCVPTLAKISRKHGYSTASFNGGGSVSARFCFAEGFNFYRQAMVDDVDLEEILARAVDWLAANHEQKFFIFFHTYEVHLPNTHTIYQQTC